MLPHNKSKSMFFVAVVAAFGAGISANLTELALAQENLGQEIYISDMSKCQPASALSEERTSDRWRIISYETTDPELKAGKIIGAASYIDVPEVRLPLGVSGWHAVYVGYWNPYYALDGGTTLKIKMSGDTCFTRINEPRAPFDQDVTWLSEAYFTTADLTGRDLVFGKVGGPFAQKAYIAYVKLVPLSSTQVAALKADWAREDTRLMHAVVDGINFMGLNEYRTREHIMEMVERYRHSDVGKVVWGVMYGDSTNYPSKLASYFAGKRVVPIEALPGAIQPPGEGESVLTVVQSAAYLKVGSESMQELASKGIIPVAVAAEHVHQMGLKFDLMFRLGIRGGSLPPMDQGVPKKFLPSHPEYRQILADGTPVDKASYAYPEVRQFVLSIIREAAETFDCDGVNLAFVRGPEYVMYEKPVMDAFQKEYGQDGRNVSLTDSRMVAVRSRFLNQFMRDARQVLDEVGVKKGKRLGLSAYVFSGIEKNLHYGMDMVAWMKEKLIDSIYCQQGEMDKEIIAAAKVNQCKFIPEVPAGDAVKNYLAGYEAGVDGFAQRDIDGVQDQPSRWAVLSRVGHREELQKSGDDKTFLSNNAPELNKTIRLKTVGGIDVLRGFWHTASSG